MRFIVIFSLLLFALLPVAAAQEDDAALETDDISLTSETDIFGQAVQIVRGLLINPDEMAYQNISIFADVYNADDELIGEGIGFPVNACGTGLLPTFALQPQSRQTFSVVLELFENDSEIDRVDVFAQGIEVDPLPMNISQTYTGLRRISDREVVSVEWLDETSLRFGVGCHNDVFDSHDWFLYNLETGNLTEIEHPNVERVTDALLVQLGLTEPVDYDHSMLTFSPTSRRIVYQTDINVMLTAEPDGSFKRLIYDDLYRHSLRGFIWLPQGRFLAYYFGALGDEVRYFTASVEGQRISTGLNTITPSQTVPGPTPDGGRAVVTTTINDITGYYLQQTGSGAAELLFEAEPPGNNWPAPIYIPDPERRALIYIIRPVNDVARLQCFNLGSGQLNDLSALPLQLTPDDRAWSWLSPDENTLAVAANGVEGGLWLVDLSALSGCDGEVDIPEDEPETADNG